MSVVRRAVWAGMFLALAACSPLQPETPTPVVLYASSAASPWLESAYACAPQVGAIIRLAQSPADADARLMVGTPLAVTPFLYMLGEEEIVIVAHAGSNLSLADVEQVQALFAGDEKTVWVFDHAEDVMRFFVAGVMRGRPITPLARLATSPQEMAQALSADKKAVGVLGRRSVGENLQVVFSAGFAPVLVETTSQPEGVLALLLKCMAE